MYRTTVVVALLVAGSLATPIGLMTNQDMTIQESSFHRSGVHQEIHRNTTQQRVSGNVEIIVTQGNSTNTHDESGNTRRVLLNGTGADSNQTIGGGSGINIAGTSLGFNSGDVRSSTEISSTIADPNDNVEASIPTSSNGYDEATTNPPDIEVISSPTEGEDNNDASVNSEYEDISDSEPRNERFRVSDTEDDNSGLSSSNEHDGVSDETGFESSGPRNERYRVSADNNQSISGLSSSNEHDGVSDETGFSSSSEE